MAFVKQSGADTCLQWTAVTRDGKRSAQFEETLLVTETGVEILTAAPGAARTSTELAAQLGQNGA